MLGCQYTCISLFAGNDFDSNAQISMRSHSPGISRQRPMTCPPQHGRSTLVSPDPPTLKARKSFSPSLLRRTLSPRCLRRRTSDQCVPAQSDRCVWPQADRCNGCGFPLNDERVSVKGDLYHLTCFKCSR